MSSVSRLQVSAEWAAAGFAAAAADGEDAHGGAACALPTVDFEQLEHKRRDLKDVTFSCQHVRHGINKEFEH